MTVHHFFPLSLLLQIYRTRGSAVSWSGRLEVYANGEWGTVCERGFDQKDANIACRALGYGSAKSVQGQATHGRGTGRIHYTNLKLVDHLSRKK